MAHESRNTLQRSLACLEVLRLEVKDQPRAVDLLARLRESQNRLQRLYEEVRTYAAPIVLEKHPCRLDDLLRDVWKQLMDVQRGKVVHFQQERSPSPLPLSPAAGEKGRGEGDRANLECAVDRFAVEQVFRNILENAIAACPDPGEIKACWTEADLAGVPGVRVAIRDNGPGLDPEQKAKIFESFYTTKTQGTGLGMAIAKRIVEAHEGHIAVGADQHPGAEILVTIPRGQS